MSAKLSFELDAGKILAKLHAGACETHEDFVFINTGITDAEQKKPEAVDKSKMNFDLEGGEYELGVMFPTKLAIEHLKQDVEKADEKGKKDAEKQKAADKKEGDDEDQEGEINNSEVPITDNPDEKSANESLARLFEDYTKNSATAGEGPDDKNTPNLSAQHDGAENLDVMKKAQQTIQDKMLAAHTVDDIKDLDAAGTAIADATKELADTAKGAAAEAVKKNHDQIKKFMEKSMQYASQYLADYMKVFSGQDVKSKINEKSLALCYVPEGFDPLKTKKYDKYQIPVMTDEQVREYKIQLLKKNPNEFNIERMCFKVAYSLDIGK